MDERLTLNQGATGSNPVDGTMEGLTLGCVAVLNTVGVKAPESSNLSPSSMHAWSSGLGRHSFKVDGTGSNPVVCTNGLCA